MYYLMNDLPKDENSYMRDFMCDEEALAWAAKKRAEFEAHAGRVVALRLATLNDDGSLRFLLNEMPEEDK